MDNLRQAAAAYLKGDLQAAQILCSQALEENPENGDAWQMLAVLHFDRLEIADAERCNARALALDPGNGAAHNTDGNILQYQDRLQDAAKSYERALELAPNLPQALTNLGDTLRRLGRLDDALVLCRKAVRLAPYMAAAHANLGAVLFDTGDAETAADYLKAALELAPEDTGMRINLARALVRTGDAAGARDNARLAQNSGGGDAMQVNSMAGVFYDLGDLETAKVLVTMALEQNPDLADAHNNLGNILTRLGRLEDAVFEFGLALQENLENPDYLANLGGAHQAAGDLAAAETCFEGAIKAEPDHADAHWNRGLARLLSGDLERGFTDYEWRWRLPEFRRRHTGIPAWDGEDLDGRTLLIHSEQGFGDTIQCIRYAALLSERGARVILETHAPLRRLMQTAPGVDQVVSRGEALPRADLEAPILSLPHLCATTLKTIPAEIPYLGPPPEDAIDFGDVDIQADLKIGIVWSGRPSHKNDRNRSCPPSHFQPLGQIEGVRLFSLQVGEASANLTAGPLTDLAPQLSDFAATAAAIAGLDLIISVDTAVAHLAGALGKACWLLLPFAPDWRWLLDRNDTPWYPSLRLFRQDRPGDWPGVLGQVAENLVRRAGGQSSGLSE
ncbi:MAG: tetratricopeptide repeat protein [Rhodospirillales bacterium]